MIRHVTLTSVAMVGIALVTGCATLSKQECLSGSWQAIGFADGAAGRAPSYLSAHSKACAKVNVAPNYQEWERGRQSGLKQYCTTTNAYQLGREGMQINAVCPAELTPELEGVNADGRKLYSLNKQLQIEKKQLAKYQEEHEKLRSGSSLNFSNEHEARSYLIEDLPAKAQRVKNRINNLQYAIDEIQLTYGY